VLRAIKSFVRRALPAVVILAVAPAAVAAQSIVCHPIRRGDTVSYLAQRLTGNWRNKYQPWFQIMAPSGSFVPKSQYDRVRPGWRACVTIRAVAIRTPIANDAEAARASAATEAVAAPTAREAVERVDAPRARAAVAAPGGGAKPMRASGLRAIGGIDLTIVWLGAAVVVPWFGWRILDDYLDRRRRAWIVMRHFADRFVREFERPLIQRDAAEPPVRVRIRSSPFRKRLDILLAPGMGRRYPNLSDHKQNVEYDVTRVLHVLADESFVNGPLYEHAEWVVVPFQFKAGLKHTGVTCISSF
jgi:hypothetical protein